MSPTLIAEIKETARRYYEALNRHEPGALDEFVAAEFRHHMQGLPDGLSVYKQILGMYYIGFPDIRHTIEEMVAEGNKVAVRTTSSGTHTGIFLGHLPTNRRFNASGIEILTIVDGRLYERRGAFDTITMLQQLGLYTPVSDSRLKG